MAIASRIFNVKKQLDDGWHMPAQKAKKWYLFTHKNAHKKNLSI